MNQLQYLVTEINENNNYMISDLMNTPNDYDGITKNSIITVDVPQGVIEEEKIVSINNNGSTVIEPSEGYDSIEKVVVNTNIPNQTTSLTAVVNGNYTPQSPYIGYSSVSVNIPQISNETLINKRITSNNNIPVSDLMSDSVNYSGISKNSNIIVDVPVPDITQISNYSITSNGSQNVPIPSGYDAVDSINLNVNVPVSNIQTAKVFNITSDDTNGPYYSKTVVPTSGYDAMSQVSVSVKLYSPVIYYYSYKTASTSSGSLIDTEYIGYSEPSDDDSTTVTQGIAIVKLHPNSSYTGLYQVGISNKIQYKTITSNGVYYPNDDQTILKKITVDVKPTISYFKLFSGSAIRFKKSNFNYNSSSSSINIQVNSAYCIVMFKKVDDSYSYIRYLSNKNFSSMYVSVPSNYYYNTYSTSTYGMYLMSSSSRNLVAIEDLNYTVIDHQPVIFEINTPYWDFNVAN